MLHGSSLRLRQHASAQSPDEVNTSKEQKSVLPLKKQSRLASVFDAVSGKSAETIMSWAPRWHLHI
jgi:hypothetical protein